MNELNTWFDSVPSAIPHYMAPKFAHIDRARLPVVNCLTNRQSLYWVPYRFIWCFISSELYCILIDLVTASLGRLHLDIQRLI